MLTMRTTHITRSLLAIAVCLVAVAAVRPGVDAAATSKSLDKSYFFGGESGGARFPSSLSIAGTTFSGTVINLFNYGAHISLNARKLPGYNAVMFKIGCSDTSEVGASSVVRILGDAASAPLAKYTVMQGQPARLEIVPFNGHGTLNFVKQYPSPGPKDCEAVIANPAAIVLGPPSAAPLTISAPTVATGSQETIAVAARPATQATVIVTYASGVQQVIGPTAVPASGRLSVTFTVAQGVHGSARVTVVTVTSDVHGAFTVTG